MVWLAFFGTTCREVSADTESDARDQALAALTEVTAARGLFAPTADEVVVRPAGEAR